MSVSYLYQIAEKMMDVFREDEEIRNKILSSPEPYRAIVWETGIVADPQNFDGTEEYDQVVEHLEEMWPKVYEDVFGSAINGLKEEMREYMVRGNTWVDLCERFVNDSRVRELLPEVHTGMSTILNIVSDIETTIEL